ncbi:MAG: ParB/RepB/Spo0J family partition protein [Erysipelotrichaceae bacterium]
MKEFVKIGIDEIVANPYQPRLDFDPELLMDLAQSIRANGLIHPISVRRTDKGYEIVAGERRYRAMKMIGIQELQVNVMDANELQMAEMALVENIQRENLSAVEEAKSYVQIMKGSKLTQAQLALKIGKSQSSIANKIRLLNLDEDVQTAVITHKISERHARALLNETKEQQKEYLKSIIDDKLKVAQIETIVKKAHQPVVAKPKFKAVTKNVKLGINTVKQAVAMSKKTGITVNMQEEENEEEDRITIVFPK